jgi:hypothetical protein
MVLGIDRRNDYLIVITIRIAQIGKAVIDRQSSDFTGFYWILTG